MAARQHTWVPGQFGQSLVAVVPPLLLPLLLPLPLPLLLLVLPPLPPLLLPPPLPELLEPLPLPELPPASALLFDESELPHALANATPMHDKTANTFTRFISTDLR
jgi:hypothetical protein